MNKKTLLPLILAGLAFFSLTAYADTTLLNVTGSLKVNIPNNTTYATTTLATFQVNAFGQITSSDFTSTCGASISNIGYWVLYNADTNTQIAVSDQGNYSYVSGNPITWTSAPTVSPGVNYWLTWHVSVGNGNSNDTCYKDVSGQKLFAVQLLSNNTNDGVLLTFPTANSTTTDFGTWEVSYTYATNSEIGGNISIFYDRNSSSTASASDTISTPLIAIGGSLGVPKSQPLIFPPLVDNTQYWVWAQLTDTSDTVVASSTPFQFDVTYGTSTAYSNSSTTAETPQCAGGGLVGDSLCKAFIYLFYPSPESVQQFRQLKDAVSAKPPFGYVSAISTILASSSWAGGTATSSLDAATNIPILMTLRAIVGYILWIVLGFYIFTRFRHVEL